MQITAKMVKDLRDKTDAMVSEISDESQEDPFVALRAVRGLPAPEACDDVAQLRRRLRIPNMAVPESS